MASHNNDSDDDDEELGAYIYRSSHTAKLFREKAALEALRSNPTSQQTQRKSPRLLATKSKQQVEIIPTTVPETSDTNFAIKQRAKRKRRSSVVKEDSSCTSVCPKSSRKQYRKVCRFDGCNSLAQKRGACKRHGAKVKRCKYDGCTNNVVREGVCIRHGAKVKRCSHEGCTNKVQKGGVCIRHGAKTYCSHEGCTNQVQKGGVCIRHGASWTKMYQSRPEKRSLY